MPNNTPPVCFAINKSLSNKAMVVAAYCADNDRKVAVNNLRVPYSPFSGRELKPLSSKLVNISVRDIRKTLVSAGTCPQCRVDHFMTKADVKKLKGKKLFCTICASQYPVELPAELNVKEKIDEKNKPEVEDDELRVESADMDDDDDDDMSSDTSDDDDGMSDDDDDDSTEDTNTPTDDISPVPTDDNSGDMSDDDDDDVMSGDDDDDDDMSDDDDDNDDDDDDDDDKTVDEDMPQTPMPTNDPVSANTKTFTINCYANLRKPLRECKLNLLQLGPRKAILCADGEPIIKFDADKATENEAVFKDPNKLGGVINEIIQNTQADAKPDFSKIGGEGITHDVDVDKTITDKIDDEVNKEKKKLAEKEKELLEDTQQSLTLATLILQRNLDKSITNPLRDNLIVAMEKVNVKNAAKLFDKAMEASSDEFVKTILAQTRSFMQKPVTARNEIAKFLEKANYQHGVRANTKNNNDDDDNDVAEILTRNSLSISTASSDITLDNEPAIDRPRRTAASGSNKYTTVDDFSRLFRR